VLICLTATVIPFIQNFGLLNISEFDVSIHGLRLLAKNILLHRSYGKLSKRGETRYEKTHGYAALSLSGSGLSAPEKRVTWS
jgi:hypothetical protein